MELVEIERRLQSLLRQFGRGIPEEQLQDMKSLVEAGEPGVALENYCSQLFEYDIAVPSHVVNELEELAQAMGIDRKYWAVARDSGAW